ncbi:MFS transporter [Alloscardovia criceti]|uniref:MFS transporter n=1 Tax=Alloscardovia criceti TaxID=356828 RepID=UPI00038179BF|nr:MFS transporter [Alloscardovia criceti]
MRTKRAQFRKTFVHERSIIAIFLVLIGAIMRAPIVVLPLYVEPMAQEMHRNPGNFGIVTSLPLLMFVLFSSFVSSIVEKLGLTKTLRIGSIVLFIGCLLRVAMTWETLLVGTALVGAGIAILNICMPTVVSEKFSDKPGIFTTAYSAAMVVGAIVLVTLSPLMSKLFGWHSMLWIMVLMAGIPMLLTFVLPDMLVSGSQEPRKHAKLRFL